jgi:hypothetical protein
VVRNGWSRRFDGCGAGFGGRWVGVILEKFAVRTVKAVCELVQVGFGRRVVGAGCEEGPVELVVEVIKRDVKVVGEPCSDSAGRVTVAGEPRFTSEVPVAVQVRLVFLKPSVRSSFDVLWRGG